MRNTPFQRVVPPVEDTVEQIKSSLQNSDGRNTLSRIGRTVQKPKSRKLLKIVLARPGDFAVSRRNQEHLVELINHEKVPVEERKGVVPPVEDTVEQIKSSLQNSEGKNTLSRIGMTIQKPKSRNLLKIVLARPGDFVVSRRNQEHLVELINHEKIPVAPGPAVIAIPAEDRKQKMESLDQATKRLKSESLTLNEILDSLTEGEINDFDVLEIVLVTMSVEPYHSDKLLFVGIDFRLDFDITGLALSRTFIDFFVGKSKFTFRFHLSSHGEKLRALLAQPQIFFTVVNMEPLWQDPFMASVQNAPAHLNLLDSQLVTEYLYHAPYLRWETILDKLLKMRFKTEQVDGNFETKRKHLFFHLLRDEMLLKLREKDVLSLQNATKNRMVHGQPASYRFGFDSGNGYLKRSSTLANVNRSPLLSPTDFLVKIPLEEENDFGVLFECLPPRLLTYLDALYPSMEHLKANVTEIVLDLGRQPYLWVGERKVFFWNTPDSLVVEQEDIDHVLEKGQFSFGPDNRAALPGQLHRIAAMKDRNGKIYGLTLQFGRHVKGNAGLILDILHGSTKSILILGPPGSGKTTLVREIARVISAGMTTAVIVDTSNEIGGGGERPHPCIGQARRMMVSSLEQQSSVMLECVQNHTPHVMIIDQIGRSNEVEAVGTIKNRGVRLIASAHGDLRGLVANADLNGFIGGVQAVTIGDGLAIQRASVQVLEQTSKIEKVVTQRVGPPIFDAIIELDRNNKHAWKVITEPCEAVDAVLNGDPYSYELRTRNPETFEMSMVRQSEG